MFTARGAIVLGAIFIVTGVVYYLLQGSGETLDRAGVVMLVAVGIAMTFSFAVLLRGSREL